MEKSKLKVSETCELDIVNELVKLDQLVEQSAKKWVADKKIGLVKDIQDRLEKHQEKILLKLMGLDVDAWGNLKIDNSINSIFSDTLTKTRSNQLLEQWITSIIGVPGLTKKQEDDIRKYYEETLIYNLKERVRYKVNNNIKEMLDQCLDKSLDRVKCMKDQENIDIERNNAEKSRVNQLISIAVAEAEQRVRAEFAQKLVDEAKAKEEKRLENTRLSGDVSGRSLTIEL